jgi:hypothetical protein
MVGVQRPSSKAKGHLMPSEAMDLDLMIKAYSKFTEHSGLPDHSWESAAAFTAYVGLRAILSVDGKTYLGPNAAMRVRLMAGPHSGTAYHIYQARRYRWFRHIRATFYKLIVAWAFSRINSK